MIYNTRGLHAHEILWLTTPPSRSVEIITANPSSETRQRQQRNALTIHVDAAPSLADDASLYIPRGSLTESRPPAGRARARRALQTRHHYLWTPRTLELVGRTGSLPSAAEAVVSRGGDPQGAKEARSTIQQAPQMVSAMGHGLRRARSDCSKRRPVPKAG
jgi:hypothetical protein